MTQFTLPLTQVYDKEEGDLHVTVTHSESNIKIEIDFPVIGKLVCSGTDEEALSKDLMLALRTLAGNSRVPDVVIEAISEIYLNLEDILYPEDEDDEDDNISSLENTPFTMEDIAKAMSLSGMPVYALTRNGEIVSLSEKDLEPKEPETPKHFFFS